MPESPDGAPWDEAAWDALAAELAAWRAAGRTAVFWWRDDDAGPADPGLDRLLGLAARAALPLGLAVVPAWLEASVAAAVRAAPPAVAVLQHGWRHANHEPVVCTDSDRPRPAECGMARPPAVALAEIVEGRARLAAALPERVLPVFVPPWNRIAPEVRAGLSRAGYQVLSTFGPRARAPRLPGPGVLNCHVDPVRWREGRRFAGPTATLSQLQDELAQRRHGRKDPAEPIGLLTHHRVMAPVQWAFLEEWLARVSHHPAASFPPIQELMARTLA